MLRAIILSFALAATLTGALGEPAARGAIGSATAGRDCWTFGGVTVDDGAGTSRSRWPLISWWPNAADPLPAGACTEDEYHMHFAFDCVASSGAGGASTLHIRARGDGNLVYEIAVADDAVGIRRSTKPPGEPLCGAGDVPVTPIDTGTIRVVAV